MEILENELKQILAEQSAKTFAAAKDCSNAVLSDYRMNDIVCSVRLNMVAYDLGQ